MNNTYRSDIIVLFSLIFLQNAFSNELNCSANGTQFTYINGIGTSYAKASATKDRIKNLLEPIESQIDSRATGPLVEVDLVHNRTKGFISDMIGKRNIFPSRFFEKFNS